MKKILPLVCLMVMLAGPAWGATYRVYPGLATGANSGATNAATWTDAWQSFADINFTLLNGVATTEPVYLYIKKGTTSRALLYPTKGGGSSTSRLIITTDSTDTGDNPIVKVSTEITGSWTQYAGTTVYSIQPVGWARDAMQCWQDTDTHLVKTTASGVTEAPTAGTFYVDTATTPDTLWVCATDGADPSTHTIDLSNSDKAVYLVAASDYITIENLVLQHGDSTLFGGIRLYTNDDCIIDNVEIGPSSGGIEIRSTNVTVKNSSIHHCWNGKNYGSDGGGSGIAINGAGGGGHIIEQNEIYSNYENFSNTGTFTGSVVIRENIIRDAFVNCINSGGTAAIPLQVYNNMIYHSPDGTAGYNNGHGLAVQTASDDVGLIAKGNLIVVNSAYDPQCVLLSRNTYTNIDLDNNLYWLTGSGGHIGGLAGTNYTTFAAWKVALAAAAAFTKGVDTNSVNADPLLNSDYSLSTPHSPAVNAGTRADTVGLNGMQVVSGVTTWRSISDRMNIGWDQSYGDSDRPPNVGTGFTGGSMSGGM